jgi:hypothetical protein
MNLALPLFIDSATTKGQPSFLLKPRMDVLELATVASLGSLAVVLLSLILTDSSVPSIRATFLFSYSRACLRCLDYARYDKVHVVRASTMEFISMTNATRTSLPIRRSAEGLRVTETSLLCLDRKTLLWLSMRSLVLSLSSSLV